MIKIHSRNFRFRRIVTGWLLFNAALTLRVAAAEDLSGAKYKNPSLPVETRIDDLLPRLTLAEKITMLGGDETRFNACGVERLGIPPIRMTDGPVGVRTGAATASASSAWILPSPSPAIYRANACPFMSCPSAARGNVCWISTALNAG